MIKEMKYPLTARRLRQAMAEKKLLQASSHPGRDSVMHRYPNIIMEHILRVIVLLKRWEKF